ncbi:MAG: hypothetical protein WA020_09965 [Candidatus Acidiferrales bacterium]
MATITITSERELHDYVSEISEHADVRSGSPLPLGNQETGGGVNFAIFSRYASRVRLELFDHPEDAAPENTPMFVQIAEGLGIRSILHADYKSTRAKLASFGLQSAYETK